MRGEAPLIGIELFAGAGGMSLGASLAGIDVKFAVELDELAAKTYAQNHPRTQLYQGDVRAINRRALAQWIDQRDRVVLFGGPPCQGFSWSNLKTRTTRNVDNWLFKEFVRVASLLRPAWIVFENVQGIVNTAEGAFVNELTEDLVALGYCTKSERLNATQFGVPQNRTRFFLVASHNGDDFTFPSPRSRAPLTVDDAIRDLPKLANGHSRCFRKYGRAIPSVYGRALRRSRLGCCNHLVTCNAPAVVERYSHVPQGGNWEDIPKRLMRNYADRTRFHTGIYHRLKADAPSIVIGNYRKNMLIHPTEDRGLSVREAARIQSFPDRYVFHGSIGFQQQQVGNAVPPLLAKSVFADPPDKKWLSKGLKQVRTVLGYPGILSPSKRSHLIVLVGFEDERAVELIRECEPSMVSLGKGDASEEGTAPHQEANTYSFNRIKHLVGEVNCFEFKAYDAVATMTALREQAQLHADCNVTIAPMNTKISTLGAALLALEDERIQLCYAPPNIYNASKYSLPDDDYYMFELPGFPQAVV